MKKFRGLILFAVFLCLFVAGCGGQASPSSDSTGDGTSQPVDQDTADSSPSTSEPIKIGMSSAITGAYSEYGESAQKAGQLAIDQWNARGGVAGRPVEFIVYDDQLKAELAVTNVQRLLNSDNVDAIFFPAGSTPALAVHSMILEANIPAINAVATSPQIVYQDGVSGSNPYRNIFNFAEQSDQSAVAIGNYVGENWKKVGLLTEETDYGEIAGGNIKNFIESQFSDVEVVGWETYQQDTPDMTAQLTRLKQAGAEVIAMVVLGNDVATARNNLNRIGWDVPLVGTAGVFRPTYLEQVGDLAIGTMGSTITQWMDPDQFTESQREFARAWKEAYGNDRYYGDGEWPPPDFELQARMYDGFNVMLYAMDRAGSTDVDAWIKVMEEEIVDFPGALGINYNFDHNIHHAVTYEHIGIAQYQEVNGEIQVVRIK